MTKRRDIAGERPIGAALDITPGADDARNVAGNDIVVDLVLAAMLDADRTAVSRALAQLRFMGLADADIADITIPAVSHRLGIGWCEDEVGFAEVTIGVARLQAMLRELAAPWADVDQETPNAPRVLMVVSEQTHHTLGAMVAAGQLRRRGISVRLLLGTNPKEVSAQVIRSMVDAIFVSAAKGDSLESLRRIVETVGSCGDHAPPVVLGGSIVEESGDLAALTGADFVTADIEEALHCCDLIAPRTARPLHGLSTLRSGAKNEQVK